MEQRRSGGRPEPSGGSPRPRAGSPGRLRAGASRRASRALACLGLCILSALFVCACGNTLQDEPLANSTLVTLVSAQRDPIYWLGASFRGLQLKSTGLDPGGAYTLQYGDCVVGGVRCVAPIEVISSPDNGFLPGAGTTATVPVVLRGRRGLSAEGGKVLEVATGPVVIDVRARSAALAHEAMGSMVPINFGGSPGAPLPKPLPSTGFDEKVLTFQHPPAVAPLPSVPGASAGQITQAAQAAAARRPRPSSRGAAPHRR